MPGSEIKLPPQLSLRAQCSSYKRFIWMILLKKKKENSGLFRRRHFWSAGEEEQRSHCTHFNMVTRLISHVQDPAEGIEHFSLGFSFCPALPKTEQPHPAACQAHQVHFSSQTLCQVSGPRLFSTSQPGLGQTPTPSGSFPQSPTTSWGFQWNFF